MSFSPKAVEIGEDTARQRRERSFLPCRIVYGPHSFTAEGVVRNRSESGASVRLTGETELPLPQSVQVVVGRDGDGYAAEVIWRKGNELGLKFTEHFDLKIQADESVRILRRMWAEMAMRPSA